jgi:hypothetical protein
MSQKKAEAIEKKAASQRMENVRTSIDASILFGCRIDSKIPVNAR